MIWCFIAGVVATVIVVYFLHLFGNGERYDEAMAEAMIKQKQEYCEKLEKHNAFLENQIKELEAMIDEIRKIFQREF